MKATFATILIVVVAPCLFYPVAPDAPSAVVKAQQPDSPALEEIREPAPEERKEIEKRFRERHHEENRPHLSEPHQQRFRMNRLELQEIERRDIERERDNHAHMQRERERQIHQQKERLENMKMAVMHLNQAGMRDLAHQLEQQVREQEHQLRATIEREMQHAHHMHREKEFLAVASQMRREIRALEDEVRELREIVASLQPKQPPRKNESAK